MVGTTPGLKKEEGKKGLLTDMANRIVAEEGCSGSHNFTLFIHFTTEYNSVMEKLNCFSFMYEKVQFGMILALPYTARGSVSKRFGRLSCHTPYPSVLDFQKIKLEKSSLINWIFSLFQTGFLLPV